MPCARVGWIKSWRSSISTSSVPTRRIRVRCKAWCARAMRRSKRPESFDCLKATVPGYRDGEQRRDFLYVKDAVAMTLHLAANRAANGIFNIGSGVANPWNELARCVFAALGAKAAHRIYRHAGIDPWAVSVLHSGETLENYSTPATLRPITPLAESVYDYIVNYLVTGMSLGAEL